MKKRLLIIEGEIIKSKCFLCGQDKYIVFTIGGCYDLDAKFCDECTEKIYTDLNKFKEGIEK